MHQLKCSAASGDEEGCNWALTPACLGQRIAAALPEASPPAGGTVRSATPRPWQGDKLQFLTIIDRSLFPHFR